MRVTFPTVVAPLLLVAAATLSTPARATDAEQAIRMCDARGSACTLFVHDNGNITITVNNGANGTGVIDCAQHGPCGVVVQAKGTKGGTGRAGNVNGILQPPRSGASVAGSGPVHSAGSKTASDGLKEAGGNPPIIQRVGSEQHSGGEQHSGDRR